MLLAAGVKCSAKLADIENDPKVLLTRILPVKLASKSNTIYFSMDQ
jgi:hypothetical protein